MDRRRRVDYLFVYGTLRPGDVRWPILAPYVVDEGWPDTVDGRLYDTGLGYPAALFGDRVASGRTIVGRTHRLLDVSYDDCLRVIDDVEGTVVGLYSRVVVHTSRGVDAFAYEYGTGLDLTEIVSGDWFER